MSEPSCVQAHVYISGRVQGVFFRAFVRQKALELGITGYVRNLRDRRVEAVFQGPLDKVQEMIHHVHEGPRFARVEKVSIQWEEISDEFSKSFHILY
ncbi:MAG: acylphosphatase [Candidatus Heimdallarchaeota archaeon]